MALCAATHAATGDEFVAKSDLELGKSDEALVPQKRL
jgi:hypothetical protein